MAFDYKDKQAALRYGAGSSYMSVLRHIADSIRRGTTIDDYDASALDRIADDLTAFHARIAEHPLGGGRK
jgi:hypothetical protein